MEKKKKKKRHTYASTTQRFTLKVSKQWLIVCFERKVLFFFRQAMAHIRPAALPKHSAQFLCWMGLSAVVAAAGIASPALPSPWWPHRWAQAGSPCPQDLPSHKRSGLLEQEALVCFYLFAWYSYLGAVSRHCVCFGLTHCCI